MKAEELRIGNYLTYNKSIAYVANINQSTLRVNFTENELEDLLCGYYEVEPIPLTEQWLLDFGFSGSEYSYHIRIDKHIISIRTISRKCFMSEAKLENPYYKYNMTELKYVHNLQNLIYSLTNQELTYSPK